MASISLLFPLVVAAFVMQTDSILFRICGWLYALAATPRRLCPCVHCWCMACRWHRGMLALQCLRRPAGIEIPQPLRLRWCAVLCCRQTHTTLVQCVNNTQSSAIDSIMLGTCACASVFVLKICPLDMLLPSQLLRSNHMPWPIVPNSILPVSNPV